MAKRKRKQPDFEGTRKRFSRGSGRERRMELQDHDNACRILPRSMKAVTEGEDDPLGYMYLIHYNIPVLERDEMTSATCAKTGEAKKPCKGCSRVKELRRADDPEDQDLGYEMRQKKRYLFNVLDLENPTEVLVLESGPKLAGRIAKFFTTKWGDFTNIDDGRDFTITKMPAKETGTGYPDYDAAPDPDRTSVRERLEKIEGWEDQINALSDEIPTPPTDEQWDSLLAGNGWPRRTKKDEETEGRKAGKSGRAKEESKPSIEPEESGEDVPPPPKDDDDLACFGEGWKPKSAKCKQCSVMKKCRKLFMDSD